MKKNKKVYIAITADILHHGHMNLFEEARKHGDIIVGLLTDAAVSRHKRLPYLNYTQREKILKRKKKIKEKKVKKKSSFIKQK